jgi:FkbM family methyltransferase
MRPRERIDVVLHERRNALARTALSVAAPRRRRCSTRYLGSEWGGWSVVPELLGADSIVYSGGIGTDASFDEALIEQFGCHVHGFDPTPMGRAHGEAVAAREPRFHMHAVGLWDEDAVVPFFAPRHPSHDSWSALNLQQTQESVQLEVRRLATVMRDLGHDCIDLLKIDIEGAEYRVLSDALDAGMRIPQIAVEFDEPAPTVTAPARLARRLGAAGYRLVARDRSEMTFVLGGR